MKAGEATEKEDAMSFGFLAHGTASSISELGRLKVHLLGYLTSQNRSSIRFCLTKVAEVSLSEVALDFENVRSVDEEGLKLVEEAAIALARNGRVMSVVGLSLAFRDRILSANCAFLAKLQ